MINKKNLLGKIPEEVGVKDAIHTAIVSVRAGCPISPGSRVKMNDNGEAVPGDGPGVADPFLKRHIRTGDLFWLLMDLVEVPNVQHTWDLPKYNFIPKNPVRRNYTIQAYADELKITYEQFMDALEKFNSTEKQISYPGTLSEDELDEVMENIERYDLWSEWSHESGYEFYNTGSSCCPEYVYPSVRMFYYDKTSKESD